MTIFRRPRRAAACGAVAAMCLFAPQRAVAQEAAPTPAPAPAATPAAAPTPTATPTAAARANPRTIVALDVDVVISRYQGDKKIASLPYALNVNATPGGPGPETQLNMSSNVAVPTNPPLAGGAVAAVQSFNYRPVGTLISLRATALDDGRFELVLLIEDSSVSADRGSASAMVDVPVLRSFKTRNTLLLRDGQQRQFTAATDRVSGEVVKIDVTARALK